MGWGGVGVGCRTALSREGWVGDCPEGGGGEGGGGVEVASWEIRESFLTVKKNKRGVGGGGGGGGF